MLEILLTLSGDSSDFEDETEMGLAEWTKKREPISCPFAKKEKEKFGFDVTKAVGSSICCCRRDKSNYLRIIQSH